MSEAMPFEETPFAFAPAGTASSVRVSPVVDELDLQVEIPVAENPYEVDRRATRHLAFVGDVITPQQKRERTDLRIGGEYLGQQFKTLVRTKGLLRRCQISPMEIAFDFISDEMLGDNKTGLQVVGQVEHGKNGAGTLFGSRKLNAIEVFPGDEIKGLMRMNRDSIHGARGFVELEPLIGVSVADVRKAQIQEFVFPYWQALMSGAEGVKMPTVLSELVTQLNERRNATDDPSLRAIVDAYLMSAEQYRNWGVSYLKMASALVRLPANQGFVHTYSPLAEMLFDQLEVRPTDEILRNPTQVGSAHSENSSSEMRELLDRMAKVMEAQVGVVATPAVEPARDPEADPINKPTPVHTDVEPDPLDSPYEPEPNPFAPDNPPAEPLELAEDRCTAITNSGERCKQKAVTNGRCDHPAHRL